jgi:hypothetical protein
MLIAGKQRSIMDVPMVVMVLLAVVLSLQIAWASLRPQPVAQAADLPPPPETALLRLPSLGDHVAMSRFLSLWLQAFDNQPGISIPFRELDYPRVVAWLDRILELDPGSDYPLLSASRVYAEVIDPGRQRIMLEFVADKFMQAPNDRWQWLAHAVFVAKHRLNDLELALRYAELLARHAMADDVPHWARQMHIYTLEDMGEIEAAMVLLGGLIDSGAISDPHELQFLQRRLEMLQAELDEQG